MSMQKKNIIIAGITSLVAIATTAYLIIKRRRRNSGDEPPADALQLDLQNPGDQSDFPAAATGGKDLG